MNSMFYNATAFNQDISTWNVLSIANMDSIFYKATAFNQDLCDWAVTTPFLSSIDNHFEGMFDFTTCPNSTSPTLASPGGTIDNPHPGPFCYDCT
eukprot:scaffold11142_cov37-Attheya_sp.AAC.2